MSDNGIYKGRIRNALISARYDHIVHVGTDRKVWDYLWKEGLITDAKGDFRSAHQRKMSCAITEKGKRVLRKLRVESGQFDTGIFNPSFLDEETMGYIHPPSRRT